MVTQLLLDALEGEAIKAGMPKEFGSYMKALIDYAIENQVPEYTAALLQQIREEQSPS